MNRAFLIAATLSLAATSQVLAADLPAAAPRQPVAYKAPPPIFSWTGFYLGINGGYGFGQSNWFNTVDGPTGHFNAGGFLLGGTLGANYQMGSFVIGLEGDGDWNDANGSTGNCLVPNCTTRSDWLATIWGRAGYAVDRVLFYGTGGVAFGDVEAAAAGFPFASTRKRAGRQVPVSNGPSCRTGPPRLNTFTLILAMRPVRCQVVRAVFRTGLVQ